MSKPRQRRVRQPGGERNAGLSGETVNLRSVRPRVAPVGLVVASAVCALSLGDSVAYLVLLAAIPVAAAAVLGAVDDVVSARATWFLVALETSTLAVVVAAAALRAPLLAFACVVFPALQPLPAVAAGLRRAATRRLALETWVSTPSGRPVGADGSPAEPPILKRAPQAAP